MCHCQGYGFHPGGVLDQYWHFEPLRVWNPDPKLTVQIKIYGTCQNGVDVAKLGFWWPFSEDTLRRKASPEKNDCSVFVSITFNKYYLKIINIISTININNNKYIKSLLKYRGTELVHFIATSHSRMANFFSCQKVIPFTVITTLQIYCIAAWL